MAGQYTGTIHAHLTGRPGGVAKDVPARTRVMVQLPRYDGSVVWAALHRQALNWRDGNAIDWLAQVRQLIPCGECRQHWEAMLVATPPDWADIFGWTVARHNQVNERLGKPVMGVEEARALYNRGAGNAPAGVLQGP